jgi:outer membrane protein assembly factor BamE (lipoprotein component of BamABCDE complex)
MLLKLLFFSFIIVQIINTKKSFFINKYIFIRFFPLKIIFFFFLIFLTPGWEGVCPWNILEDTVYSENFNIYNIDKIKIDMTRTEIIDLIGDPLTKYNFQDKEHWESWTRDGKSKVGDYAWFGLHIQFDDNNKVKKISSEWNYD